MISWMESIQPNCTRHLKNPLSKVESAPALSPPPEYPEPNDTDQGGGAVSSRERYISMPRGGLGVPKVDLTQSLSPRGTSHDQLDQERFSHTLPHPHHSPVGPPYPQNGASNMPCPTYPHPEVRSTTVSQPVPSHAQEPPRPLPRTMPSPRPESEPVCENTDFPPLFSPTSPYVDPGALHMPKQQTIKKKQPVAPPPKPGTIHL